MDQLTKKQEEILFLIRAFAREKGYPPTVRDLVSLTGKKSTAGVQKLLDALERKRCIKKAPGCSRGIVPLGRDKSVTDIALSEEQLAAEVAYLRQRIAELETAEAKRQQAEEALRESEGKYRSVVERANDGIVIIQDGILKYANQAMAKMSGYTIEGAIDTPFTVYIPSEERSHAVELYGKRMAGDKQIAARYPSRLLHKDGRRIDVEISGSTITYQGKPADLAIIRDISERRQAEEALYESEERFRTVVEQAADAIIAHDIDGQVLIVNSLACKYTGYSKEELLTMNVLNIDHEIIKKDHRRRYWEKLQIGTHVKIETSHRRKDGSVYPAELQLVKIAFKGKPIILTFGRDITERKAAEEALHESEEKYRALVESSDDSIYLVNSNCKYLYINSRYQSRLGLQSRQAIGRSYSEFHSPEETKDFTQRVKRVIKSGKSLSYEYTSIRDKRHFMRTLSPVSTFEDGKAAAVTVIAKDITDLKQAELALREREAFNFALFQYNPAETVVVDCEGRVTGFNLAKKNSGDRLPFVGELMYKDYAGKHEIDMRAELMESINSGKMKEFPERKYGDKYLSITISPFSKGALVISDDITERKLAEEQLQRERDTFYSILEKAPYGVILIDKNGRNSFVNSEFTNITGYTQDDVPSGKDWVLKAYPDQHYRKMVIETWNKDLTQVEAEDKFRKKFGRSFSKAFRVLCKNGAVKEIEFRRAEVGDGKTITMLSDITERKQLHDLLEAAAKEWRTTFDAISDAVCLFDLEGRIKRCNNAMQGLVGKPFSEIADRPCWEVLHDVSKPPKQCPVVAVREGRSRKNEIVPRDSHWYNISIDPIHDEGGNLLGGVHIMSDITERIQTEKELQKSREELRNLSTYLQSVREGERTRIAREIHDELAQSLTALRMDLSWLDNRLPRDQMSLFEKIRSMTGLINTTIQTVKRISADLRPGILDDLGLVAAIEWQAEEFQNRTGIKCSINIGQDNLSVEQDRSTAIFRIFQETLTNVARHSRATRVTVRLKMKGGMLNLMVKDNGKGIAKKHIFDSKSFGLIGMRERVYPWGGKVNVDGSSGKGTTVLVSVPVENV